MVRAKFYVYLKTEYTGGSIQIVLNPVTNDTEENKLFWKYTPSGKLEMTINNKEVGDMFKIGQEYYIDFSPVLTNEESKP